MRHICVAAIAVAALAGQEIDQPQPYTAARMSSGARDGSNYDSVQVAPGGSYTVADIAGAGRIVHLWFTFATSEPDYLHTTRLKIYWDGASAAAVDVPIGDFHGLGHGTVRQFSSSFVEVEARPELNHNLANKNVAGFNSFPDALFQRGAGRH